MPWQAFSTPRHFRVRVEIVVVSSLWLEESAHGADAAQIDLDLFSDSINGSRRMADVPQIETERIFHETKFVFLACHAGLSRHSEATADAVVHTTVDVSLPEAWAKTPASAKCLDLIG